MRLNRFILCLLSLSWLGAAACGDPAGFRPASAPEPVQPLALSFPDGRRPSTPSNAVKMLAERVAPAYAMLTIYEKDETSGAFPDRSRGLYKPDIAARTIIDASAFIVDERGHLVTAAHIARGPQYGAQVLTMDGRRHEARILHVDPGRELALLRIDPFQGMHPAVLAESDSFQRGDPAVAIGAPDRTAGVISVGTVHLPRRRTPLTYGAFTVEHGIQLEMEVESGDSGGPVFDRDGRVIGMIASYLLGDTTQASYVSPGIAFAVPASTIRDYLRERLGR